MLKKFNLYVLIGAGLSGLAGCSATDLFSETYFVTPENNGTISQRLGAKSEGYTKQDSDGHGYAIKVGYTSKDLVAVTGIIPGSDGGAAVPSGTATYYGTWVVGGYQNVRLSGSSLKFDPMASAGAIVLDADFGAGTLNGTGNSVTAAEAEILVPGIDTTNLREGTLEVAGTIDGASLGGQVTFDGVNGALRGVIGDEKTVGAFHGKGGKLVYSGGFYAQDDIAAATGVTLTGNPAVDIPAISAAACATYGYCTAPTAP